MGQGATITISNFSDHVLGIGVPQHDYTSGWEALDQLNLQPRSGHAPVYIEGTGITSNSYVTLSLTVMKRDADGKYVKDDAYTVSDARVELTGDHWRSGNPTNGALDVQVLNKDFKQDVIAIFLRGRT
jgi:hypothetical protein